MAISCASRAVYRALARAVSLAKDGKLGEVPSFVSEWRAEHGTEREIFFAQEHPPGRLALSDFTVTDEPGICIAGLAFPHRLYQFFARVLSGSRHTRS